MFFMQRQKPSILGATRTSRHAAHDEPTDGSSRDLGPQVMQKIRSELALGALYVPLAPRSPACRVSGARSPESGSATGVRVACWSAESSSAEPARLKVQPSRAGPADDTIGRFLAEPALVGRALVCH